MAYHNGMYFTTKDNDNDNHGYGNCALLYDLKEPVGGWWYDSCAHITPNIIYNNRYGMLLNSEFHALPYIEIKVRSHNCNI